MTHFRNLSHGIASAVYAIVLCAELLLPHPARSGQERYDLGGPCLDQFNPGSKEMYDAEKTGQWDPVVVLEKEFVRASCGNSYRWYELVNTLLKAGRNEEATRVLQEMDTRGFEVNPRLVT